MPSTLYSAMTIEVRPDVSACPDISIINALRTVSIEFFQRSLAWLYEHPEQTTVKGVGSYEYQVPDEAVVTKLMSIKVSGRKLVAASHDHLDTAYSDWQAADGTPIYVTQFNEREYRLVPTPDVTETNSTSIIVALKPTRDSTGIDTTMYEEHLDTLVHGAKAKLMEIPGKTWTNLMLASYHKDMFNTGIAAAKAASTLGFGRASLTIKPRSFR